MLKTIEILIKRYKKVLKYLLLGGFLFVLDYSISLISFYAFDVSAGLASAIGFTTSFIIGFILSRKIVFKHDLSSRFSLIVQIVLYFSVAIANLLISSMTVQLLFETGLSIEIAKAMTALMIACWNFVIFNKFIFSAKNVNS